MAPVSKFIAALRFLVGTKWEHQGRTRQGLDCVGLILMALLLAGWQPQRPRLAFLRTYPPEATDTLLLQIIAGEGNAIEGDSAAPGDILVFHFPSQVHPQHVGVITSGAGLAEPTQFVHASAIDRKTAELELRDSDRDAVNGIYRVANIVNDLAERAGVTYEFTRADLAAAEAILLGVHNG